MVPMATEKTEEKQGPDAVEIGRRAVDIAADRGAHDVVLLDVRGLCSYADAFVLLSGETKRQVKAIEEEIGKELRAEGHPVSHTEGEADAGWVLMDFGDVIVHIFGREERTFYGLEDMWRRAVPLIRIQ
jgi:ribosome-associated protein